MTLTHRERAREREAREHWTITTESHRRWHSLPVACIRDADGELLAIQFYPEWEAHKAAFGLMVRAQELAAAAEFAREACRKNIVMASVKDEAVLLEAFERLTAALAPRGA